MSLLFELKQNTNRPYLIKVLKYALDLSSSCSEKVVRSLLEGIMLSSDLIILSEAVHVDILTGLCKFVFAHNDREFIDKLIYIVIKIGDRRDIYNMVISALCAEKFDVCESMFERYTWTLEELKSSLKANPGTNSIFRHNMTVKVFDYIVSKTQCNKNDLDYLCHDALRHANYQLFKRIVDYRQ